MVSEKKIRKVVYTPVVGDLFNFGHLQFLRYVRLLGDHLICGVMTDDAVASFRQRPIANLDERKAIFENLAFVDQVMVQDSKDPEGNLRSIRGKWKDAEITLVYGSNWKTLPRGEFLKSIKARVVHHPHFYNKFADSEIVRHLLTSYRQEFQNPSEFFQYFKLHDFMPDTQSKAEQFSLGTKGDTLQAIRPLLTKSVIEDLLIFTEEEWKRHSSVIGKNIRDTFSPDTIVVRSSAQREDTSTSSMAGVFQSVLGVDSKSQSDVAAAVMSVIRSYHAERETISNNQILVQRQTKDIKISGVIFTRVMETNAPYYVIDYDDTTGMSDRVTKGQGHASMKMYRFTDPKLYPKEFRPLLAAVKEIEELIPKISLDIEFAITKKGKVVIFQVRPLSVNAGHNYLDNIRTKKIIERFKEEFASLQRAKSHLAGNTTYLADMPDWNPAEIIGDRPNHLDQSLYAYIITNHAWHRARTSQGYANVDPAQLVVMFGGKPYVDVRSSFNSFVPADLPQKLREKLVLFYLHKLKTHPELQDKVEFDIVFTCFDLTFSQRSKELRKHGFSEKEIQTFKISLLSLTNKLLENYTEEVKKDLAAAVALRPKRSVIGQLAKEKAHDPRELLSLARELLDHAVSSGTIQFSRLARLAFIGKILLRSLVSRKIIDTAIYHEFLSSISTVATKMDEDFLAYTRGELHPREFLARYGHLRPGTYDITSLRYDADPALLVASAPPSTGHPKKESFVLPGKTAQKITAVFRKEGLAFDASYFFEFLKTAIEAREFSKFEFTKNLSDAIECIAKAGALLGFSREEMSSLDTENLFDLLEVEDVRDMQRAWKDLIRYRMEEKEEHKKVLLPPIIYSPQDLEIIAPYVAKPNFITEKKVEGKIVNLRMTNKSTLAIKGNIVLLENGDPGYDWIFTRKPLGLITKYGGVASHMAIRCAEFGLPAAIGCGEVIFSELAQAKGALLDCGKKKIIVR